MSDQAMPGFMQRFFGGDSRSLIAHFIQQEDLNEEDISYLQSLLKDKKQAK
ncbi:MAG: BlaI/MecI/CopY family transcriptional regulator [Pararheinheimera sp.]|nr:BlaI/MecI/CopY family transcriptional regulator [Rheinheimera sp.]